MTVNEIIEKIDNSHPKQLTESDRKYYQVHMYQSLKPLDQNCLYVAKASTIDLADLSDYGFFIINDNGIDLSKFAAHITEFHGNTDITHLFNSVKNVFFYNHYILESSQSLLNALINGKGIQNILDTASIIFGNPIFLGNLSFRIHFSSGIKPEDNSHDKALMNSIQKGYQPYNDLKTLNILDSDMKRLSTSDILGRMSKSTVPIFISFKDTRRMMFRIMVAEQFIAYICLTEINRHITIYDEELFALLAEVIAKEIPISAPRLFGSDDYIESVMLDLIKGDIRRHDQLIERMPTTGWLLNSNFHIVFIVNQKEFDKKNPHDNYSSLVLVKRKLYERNQMISVVYFDENLVILTGAKNTDQLSNIIEKLEALFIDNDLYGGASSVFPNLLDLGNCYEQAKTARRLGIRLKDNACLCRFEEMYFYDMLDTLSHHTDISKYCVSGLSDLLEFDRQNDSQLNKTLYTFLMCGKNIREAARRLYVHRNTVSYRLEKISDLTGMDLFFGEDSYKLFLSYKILAITEKLDECL